MGRRDILSAVPGVSQTQYLAIQSSSFISGVTLPRTEIRWPPWVKTLAGSCALVAFALSLYLPYTIFVQCLACIVIIFLERSDEFSVLYLPHARRDSEIELVCIRTTPRSTQALRLSCPESVSTAQERVCHADKPWVAYLSSLEELERYRTKIESEPRVHVVPVISNDEYFEVAVHPDFVIEFLKIFPCLHAGTGGRSWTSP